MKKFIVLALAATLLACFGVVLAVSTITIKGSDTLVRLGQR